MKAIAFEAAFLVAIATTGASWLACYPAVLVYVDVGGVRAGAPAGAWDDAWRQQLQTVEEALDFC